MTTAKSSQTHCHQSVLSLQLSKPITTVSSARRRKRKATTTTVIASRQNSHPPPKHRISYYYLALQMVLTVVASERQESSTTTSTTCDLWLAPSTIPGAGFGLYTGVDRAAGQDVTPGDASIPIVDLEWNNGQYEQQDDENNTNEDDDDDDDSDEKILHFLWDEYTWSAEAFVGMKDESTSTDVHGASFGIGALPNCLFSNINTEESYTQLSSPLHRSKDPGAGAISPYWDRRGVAMEDMVAGQEIFVDYGYEYFLGDRERSIGLVPFVDDYENAHALVEKLFLLEGDLYRPFASDDDHEHGGGGGIDLAQELYSFVTQQLSTIWPSRLWWAFPSSPWKEVKEYIMEGYNLMFWLNTTRDLDWLKQNGQCIGHLHIEESKVVPQAGRGVFTDKAFRKGDIVTAVPLLHLPNRSILNIYKPVDTFDDDYMVNTDEEGAEFLHLARNTTAVIHSQLLLNYCFGHAESTLLLCPYGVVSSVINHGTTSTKRGQHPKANLRIEWNTKLSSELERWKVLPIEEWAKGHRAELVLNYVALRDIQIGEELYLDYGKAWENAWSKHVRNWKPAPNANNYIPSWEYNAQVDIELPTLRENPAFYNNGYVTMNCREIYRVMNGMDPMDQSFYPCRVVQRHHNQHGEYSYVVELTDHEIFQHSRICYEVVTEVLFDIPRDAFYFLDVPFSRDHAEPWSFRHELHLPDDVFFKAWKNNKKK